MSHITTRDGTQIEVRVTMEDYQEAFESKKTLAQHLNSKYDVDEERGTAYEQILASNQIFVKPDRDYGIKAPTVKQILNNNYDVNLGVINRNDGKDPYSPQGRILFASMQFEMMNNQLMESNDSYEGTFNQLVALNTSVDTPRWDIPEINTTAPMAVRAQPIAQLATPASMVSITLGSYNQKIETRSIGIEISDEAQAVTTIDLLNIALRQQASAERAMNIDNALYSMVMGDIDKGTAALTGIQSTTFDPSCVVGTTFTHKAYIKFLRSQWKKMGIDWIVCDLDTYLRIEGRTGRPTMFNDDPSQARLTSMLAAANPNIPDSVNYFIVEPDMLHDGGAYGSATHPLGGTGKVLGIDSSKAIRKVTYAGAAYSGIEEYVMRRATAMRFDYSEGYYKMYRNNDGFRLMQI